MKKGLNSQLKVRELEEKGGKSGNLHFDRLSEPKSSTTALAKLNAVSGKMLCQEVRQNSIRSGRSQEK